MGSGRRIEHKVFRVVAPWIGKNSEHHDSNESTGHFEVRRKMRRSKRAILGIGVGIIVAVFLLFVGARPVKPDVSVAFVRHGSSDCKIVLRFENRSSYLVYFFWESDWEIDS